MIGNSVIIQEMNDIHAQQLDKEQLNSIYREGSHPPSDPRNKEAVDVLHSLSPLLDDAEKVRTLEIKKSDPGRWARVAKRLGKEFDRALNAENYENLGVGSLHIPHKHPLHKFDSHVLAQHLDKELQRENYENFGGMTFHITHNKIAQEERRLPTERDLYAEDFAASIGYI